MEPHPVTGKAELPFGVVAHQLVVPLSFRLAAQGYGFWSIPKLTDCTPSGLSQKAAVSRVATKRRKSEGKGVILSTQLYQTQLVN